MGGNGSKRVVCYVHAPSRVAAPEKAGGDAVGVEHTPGLYLSNTYPKGSPLQPCSERYWARMTVWELSKDQIWPTVCFYK